MSNFPVSVFLMILLFSFCYSAEGQDDNTFFWRGKVINGDTGQPVPNAVIAVYSKTTLYSADIDGIVRLRLQENDSIRVVVLGYSAETFRIKNLQKDSTGHAILKVYPVSFLLKEVTVKGHKGFLNPHIFPKFEENDLTKNMNLPGDIGSKMSDLPPSERILCENTPLFSLKELTAIIISPISYVYSNFSVETNSIKQLRKDRYQQYNENRLKEFISPEAIASITGYEGEELQKFIIYCNANLSITQHDNGASITTKIEGIFEKYKLGIEN
jgi:hypothetical protein